MRPAETNARKSPGTLAGSFLQVFWMWLTWFLTKAIRSADPGSRECTKQVLTEALCTRVHRTIELITGLLINSQKTCMIKLQLPVANLAIELRKSPASGCQCDRGNGLGCGPFRELHVTCLERDNDTYEDERVDIELQCDRNVLVSISQ